MSQNEMWPPISPCNFFESGWDTEVVFGCSITDWTVYRHTFRKDWAPKDGIWVQNGQSLFFELSGESEVVLWGKFCFELYIDIRGEWVFRHKTRCGPQSVPYFFELSGESEVVLG